MEILEIYNSQKQETESGRHSQINCRMWKKAGEHFRWLEVPLSNFSDLSRKIFRFVQENFQICLGKFSDLSGKIFRSVREEEDNDYNKKEEEDEDAKDHIWSDASVRGSHGLSARRVRRTKLKAGQKGRQLEVGAQRAPRLLVTYIFVWIANERRPE